MELNIALIGYGKMGRAIAELAPGFGRITAIIDQPADWDTQSELLKNAGVAVEFSTPSAAYANCSRCLEWGIPVVTGTTGWQNQLDRLLETARSRSASLIHGSNFSIGANLFFAVNTCLARMMNSQEQYDLEITEKHHTTKLDKPSGTAITLAELILCEISRKRGWRLDTARPGEIPLFALREERVPGIHETRYFSPEDELLLRHQANNRQGFARGALKAARWLVDHPGVYDFKDIFHLL